ncbi:MAG: hypothetical protein ABEH78_01595 [Haloferacaceae archaeon]
MVLISTKRWESLEQWSPNLFIIAGVLAVVFAAFEWTTVATCGQIRQCGYLTDMRSIFGPAGFVVGFIGLLGLYPEVADRSPKLARAGAVFAALGAVGFSMSIVATLGEIGGVLPAQPAWAPVYIILIFTGAVVGYPAIAAAGLRTNAYSRTLGVLLLVPAILFVAVLGLIAPGIPAWVGPIVGSGHALSLLAIGYVLRTETVSDR